MTRDATVEISLLARTNAARDTSAPASASTSTTASS
jgi:hypothetical protein